MFTYNVEDVTEKEVTFKNAALESFPTRCEVGVVELNRMCEHMKAHYILLCCHIPNGIIEQYLLRIDRTVSCLGFAVSQTCDCGHQYHHQVPRCQFLHW